MKKRRQSTCEFCEGYGYKPGEEAGKDTVCQPCAGTGRRTSWVTETEAGDVEIVEEPAARPAVPPTSAPPVGAVDHVVFVNPSEAIEVKPMSAVPPGQLWLLDARGNFTKYGAGT